MKGKHKFSSLDKAHQQAAVLGTVKFLETLGTRISAGFMAKAFAEVDPVLDFYGEDSYFYLPVTFKADLEAWLATKGLQARTVSPSMN